MTDIQKAFCRELLHQAYDTGFGSTYPLAPIAEKLGVTETLYDEDTNTGLLWSLGDYVDGYLHFSPGGTHAGVNIDFCDMVAHYCDYCGYRG